MSQMNEDGVVTDGGVSEAAAPADDFGGLSEFLDHADNNFNDLGEAAGEQFPAGAPAEAASPAEVVPSEGRNEAPPAQEAAKPQAEQAPNGAPTGDNDDVGTLRIQLAQALRVAQEQQMKLEQLTQPAAGVAAVPQGREEVTDLDWLQGQDPTVYFEDSQKFNGLLNTLFTVAVRTAEASAHEKVLRAIPQIVATSAQQHVDVTTAVNDFYNANQDLTPFKSAVALAATHINSKEPNLPLTDLFAKAGAMTREIMRLRKATPPVRPAVPAAVSGGGGRATGTQLSAIEKQIAELCDL